MPKSSRVNNRFDQFKATSPTNSSGGWLSTKKRGRDDERIAHDAKLAMNARKKSRASTSSGGIRSRSKSTSKAKAKAKGKSATATKARSKSKSKSKSKRSFDHESESEDSFIVSEEEDEYDSEHDKSEDEDEADFIEESDEEEELVEDDIFDEESDGDGDDNDNDSIEDDDSSIEEQQQPSKFGRLGTNSKTNTLSNSISKSHSNRRRRDRIADESTSTSTSTLAKARGIRSKDRTASRNASKKVAELGSRRQKQLSNVVTLDSSSDSSDEDEGKAKGETREEMMASPATRKRPGPGTARASSYLASSSDEDDDDDVELLETPFSKASKRTTSQQRRNGEAQTRTKSRFFEDKKKTESSSQSQSPALHMKSKSRSNSSSISKLTKFQLNDSDSDDGEDFGMKSHHRKKASSRLSKQVQKRKQPQAVLNLSDTDEDIQDEMDEAMMVSLAMEKSRKEYERSQKKILKKSQKEKQKQNKSKIVYKDDLEDDEQAERQRREEEEEMEDGMEEEVEEYRDENEIEASNVLATANSLSAQILSIMTTWCHEENFDHNSAGGGESVPKGMILDGALSLSSLQRKSKDDGLNGEEKKDDREGPSNVRVNDATWISQETMREICPQIVLKDYQLIGVNWMALLNRLTFDLGTGKGGKARESGGNVNGVLADEMGLGKTCQTIAFLAWLKYHKSFERNGSAKWRKNAGNDPSVIEIGDSSNDEETSEGRGCDDVDNKPHIIIVPASVLDNWMLEFKKFCPAMNVVKYHGTMAERQELKDKLRRYLPKKTPVKQRGRFSKALDVVVTTYSYFSSEKSDDRSFLRKFDWNYMVVDEAHCLKNPRGSRYKNMDCFSTERRLLLTGTPVQNSPKELMSLLCFLMPLFTRQASNFEEDNSNDGGERMLEHFVRIEALNGDGKNAGNVSQEEAYRKLKQLFAPFVLRRSKDDLGRVLPPKTHQVEWVPFDDSVKKTYDSILEDHLQSKGRDTQSKRNHLFTQLRKAANNALLLRTRHQSPEAMEHLSKTLFTAGYFGRDATCTQSLVKKELESFSDYDIHCAALTLIEENHLLVGELDQYLLQEDDMYCSPKFIRLKEMLPKLIKEGHRILIFSQWTRCLDLLGCLMDTLGLRFIRLDGQTSIPDRQNLIDEFNNDNSINVFLLSTRAGGMGINLTAADTCILHDLDFNPFNDLQAENRVHRFGQTKPVTIIKMVTENTVDADIYQMQQRKARMNEAIMESKTAKERKKDSEEVQAILKMAVSRYKTSESQ